MLTSHGSISSRDGYIYFNSSAGKKNKYAYSVAVAELGLIFDGYNRMNVNGGFIVFQGYCE